MRGFFLVLFLLIPSAASAQMVPTPVAVASPTITYEWLSEVLGFTYCYQNRAVSFVVAGLSDNDRAEVTAHELRHREQYARFPTCADAEKYRDTLTGRVVLETEAYAVGMCVAVKLGADRIALRRKFVGIITERVAQGQMSPLVVTGLLWKYEQQECPA